MMMRKIRMTDIVSEEPQRSRSRRSSASATSGPGRKPIVSLVAVDVVAAGRASRQSNSLQQKQEQQQRGPATVKLKQQLQ